MTKGWLLKIMSFLSFHIDVVAAIHQIFHLVLVSFNPAMGECWRKLSIGLQWNTLGSLTHELNSHHRGITLWHKKNRWEADSALFWQKGQRSFSMLTCLLIKTSSFTRWLRFIALIFCYTSLSLETEHFHKMELSVLPFDLGSLQERQICKPLSLCFSLLGYELWVLSHPFVKCLVGRLLGWKFIV